MTYRVDEFEDALRKAFVELRADCIVITSRREVFQIQSANYGVNRGWLDSRADNSDEQSSVWILRLTDRGREHFGLAKVEGRKP